jgi:hypothetical protein
MRWAVLAFPGCRHIVELDVQQAPLGIPPPSQRSPILVPVSSS